ncbi:MAG TPA: AmiS/UreI family transporter [Acidiferrobacter sp.]|nr:AmiS/UreI family transporter [Acidiferrobacter sp.]
MLKVLFVVVAAVGLLLCGVHPALAAVSGAAPAAHSTAGKWIAPLMYIGAFALLANGLMHLDPERKKASEFGVGIITAVAGLMWWPFLIAMTVVQGLGPLTNFVTGLAGMYAFFFIALGFTQLFHVESRHSIGAVAIFIGWLTGVYGYFFLTHPAPHGGGTWIYHFSICLVWFVAMNVAGLLMQKRMNERLVGWVVTFAAIYTFAIPGILWSMPPGHQGPF